MTVTASPWSRFRHFTTSRHLTVLWTVEASCHVITICNLLWQLPASKVSGEAGREITSHSNKSLTPSTPSSNHVGHKYPGSNHFGPATPILCLTNHSHTFSHPAAANLSLPRSSWPPEHPPHSVAPMCFSACELTRTFDFQSTSPLTFRVGTQQQVARRSLLNDLKFSLNDSNRECLDCCH